MPPLLLAVSASLNGDQEMYLRVDYTSYTFHSDDFGLDDRKIKIEYFMI